MLMTEKNIHQERILILDFGSQVTQLIARRVREIGVYCELWAWDVTADQIKEFNPAGIILSGSPESVTDQGSPRAPEYVFEAGVPVLGICYGMQTMAHQLGGSVQGSSKREYGYALVDTVTAIPDGFVVAAHTETCPYAAMLDEKRKFYGVQFHPEVTHTVSGAKMLENFVKGICGLEGLWSPNAK